MPNYFFIRAFILAENYKALAFRNFTDIESGWVKDHAMSERLAKRLKNRADSMNSFQGVVWL
jgi:hypothetical protein